MGDVLRSIRDALAPVINNGSAVIAVAFVAGVITYRLIRKRKGR